MPMQLDRFNRGSRTRLRRRGATSAHSRPRCPIRLARALTGNSRWCCGSTSKQHRPSGDRSNDRRMDGCSLNSLIPVDQIPRDRVYEFGPFRLSTRSWILAYRDRPLHVSRCEFVVLLEFLERPQTILPPLFLIDRLWPGARQTGRRTLTVYVYRLNRLLSIDHQMGHYIQGIRREGYKFRCDVRCSATSF